MAPSSTTRSSGFRRKRTALIVKGNELIPAWFTPRGEGIPRVEPARSQVAGASFTHLATLGRECALGRVDLAWWQDGFAVSWLDQVDGQARLQLARFDRDARLKDQRELAALDGGRVSGFPKLRNLKDQRLCC